MSEREVEQWITVNGKHIPLYAGDTKEDAIKRLFEEDKKSTQMQISKDADDKEKQIARNKVQAESAKSAQTQVERNAGTEQTAEQFNKSISNARSSRPETDRWRVDVHTADDYTQHGCKMWKSDGGSTVAVTKEGDIISVCKHADDNETRGWQLLDKAVKMGGVKLDSFAGNHEFYTRNGFEPVSWTPFNEEYAPDGWKESGCGKEPVVFYKYVGKNNVRYTDFTEFKNAVKPFEGENGYDDAYAYRDSQIKRKS